MEQLKNDLQASGTVDPHPDNPGQAFAHGIIFLGHCSGPQPESQADWHAHPHGASIQLRWKEHKKMNNQDHFRVTNAVQKGSYVIVDSWESGGCEILL